jgi:hypothetical protein
LFASCLAVKDKDEIEMIHKIKELGAKKTWPSWPCVITISLFVILLFLSNANASDFLNSRKMSVLDKWKKEIKTPYPTTEVLLATRYFIRDVLAENQQFIMTNDGSYWNALRAKYGGKQSQLKNKPLERLYDFNWYVFQDLKKYREPKPDNLKQFFTDYLGIVDLFCNKIPDSTKVYNFFETYYTDWLVSATYNRDYLPRLKPVLNKGIADLPKGMQALVNMMDSLEGLLKEPEKHRARIDSTIKSANNGFLKNDKYYLTFNLFSGKQIAGLINAFRIEDDFRYPVKIGKDTVEMAVLKLRCIDNLSLSIAVPGYYYKKQVFIFPENQPYAWSDFSAFFKGTKDFPFLDLFVCDTTIQSYFDHGMISQSGYDELMGYYSWLKTSNGHLFVDAINRMCNPPMKLTYNGWLDNLEKSLLLHEVVGHGGTFFNGVIKEPDVPTFEYHVDAEFYAYVLQFLYSPIQGFDLACMFSHMANPLSFSNQYGDAYLNICNELLISIDKNKDLTKYLKKWAGANSKDTITNLIKNFKAYGNLDYKKRIQNCLMPLVSFLNELSLDERKSLLNSIYFRNTKKPIPEPIIAAARP